MRLIDADAMEELKPCPRCGAKAYLSRDVADGFYTSKPLPPMHGGMVKEKE